MNIMVYIDIIIVDIVIARASLVLKTRVHIRYDFLWPSL